MIAAVCPFYHGRAALVVGAASRVYDVGRLVCVEHGAASCGPCAALPPTKRGELRYRREVDGGDVGDVVARIIGDAVSLGATSFVIEHNPGGGKEAECGRGIAAQLGLACWSTVGICEKAELPPGGNRRDIVERARALLPKGESEHGDVREVQQNGPQGTRVQSVMAEGVAGSVRDSARAQVSGWERDGACSPTVGRPGETSERSGIGSDPATGPAPERSAGIDPGSRWVAVCILDASGYVASRSFEVGRVLTLDKPRTVKRGDGSTYEITTRRVISDEDIERLLGAIALYLAEHGVSRVAVERASFFHAGGDGQGAQSAHLARAQWVGGEIAGALRAEPTDDGEGARFKVTTKSSAEWRASLKAGGRTWQEGLAARLPGLPTDEHVADAAGVGLTLFDAPKAPRAPRKPGEKRDKSAARKAREAAKREAAGCVCKGAHRLPCALAVAANEKRREKMTGNKSRKGRFVS